MKIRFLGTSHGIPTADRFCSSTMIEVNGAVYVIDAGGPLLDMLLRAGKTLTDVKGVFITHAHADHMAGLYGFLDTVNWYYKQASMKIFMPEQKACDLLTDLLEFVGNRKVDENRICWELVEEGMFYKDENIKITAYLTAHLKKFGRPSFAYLVEAEGKKVVFTGDMSQWFEEDDYPKAATLQETDVVICEFAHFTAEQIESYMEKTKTKQFWFNHIGLSKNFDRFVAIKGMEKKFSYPVYIACDGDEIELHEEISNA